MTTGSGPAGPGRPPHDVPPDPHGPRGLAWTRRKLRRVKGTLWGGRKPPRPGPRPGPPDPGPRRGT